MEGDRESLASELLHEVKATSKRWFILFIICLIMLFTTNLAWLYAWNLPAEETSTEIARLDAVPDSDIDEHIDTSKDMFAEYMRSRSSAEPCRIHGTSTSDNI